MQTTVKLSEQINPHFYTLWHSQKDHIIAKGGRGSFKSSVISLRLAVSMLEQIQDRHQANVICVRKAAADLRDTVYKQVLWALDILQVSHEFRTFVSPMKIVHRRTGSAFYFYGADNPEKLKSNSIPNVIGVWFEEAAELKGPIIIDQSEPTFIRHKSPFVDHVPVFLSYNPPRNPFEWINEWVEQKQGDEDYLIDTSTYLDDKLGFTTKQTLRLIESYKRNDYDYYRWLYLGEVIGMGNNVYNMDLFQPLDELPSDDYITNLYMSVDGGHEVSATTALMFGLTRKRNVILLSTYYYSPAGKARKKAPSELSKDLHDWEERIYQQYHKRPVKRTLDSAEGALDNQYKADYGISFHKVAKLTKADMVDRVQDLLAQGRFYYLDTNENKIFIEEHRNYRWDEKTINGDRPEVIKEDDHTADAFLYFARDNEAVLGLSIKGVAQMLRNEFI